MRNSILLYCKFLTASRYRHEIEYQAGTSALDSYASMAIQNIILEEAQSFECNHYEKP